MRAPLGAIAARFMKLSGGVNGLSVPPPFAGNHDNQEESRVGHGYTPAPWGGVGWGFPSLTAVVVRLCSGLENKLISLTLLKSLFFPVVSKLIKLRIAATNDNRIAL